jgi:hypothetical protein
MLVSDFLSEDNWCKNKFAKNAEGSEVLPTDSSACCWCLLGAIHKVYSPTNRISFKELCEKLKLPPPSTVSSFNDSPTTTFADVKEFLLQFGI